MTCPPLSAHHGVILYDPASVLERELDAVRRRMTELGSTRVELPDGSPTDPGLAGAGGAELGECDDGAKGWSRA